MLRNDKGKYDTLPVRATLGMRWERYIRGGIFGERYIRRLGLGRKPP